MKFSMVFLCLQLSIAAFAQRKITATDFFTVSGKVKSEKSFTVAALNSFPKQAFKDQIIYNHKGEIKDTLRNCKGVLLKTVLATTELVYEKPKELNGFYFVMTASDGYKTVFSWNEIYNTDVGDHLFLITEQDGKPIRNMKHRIALISAADLKSGRRYVKALQKIEIRCIE